jgi:hypothetical protein
LADESIDRSKLTFEQAEGVAPLARQLELQEVSPQLRAVLWDYVHRSLVGKTSRDGYLFGDWQTILRDMHVHRYHKMADEFTSDEEVLYPRIKGIFVRGTYLEIFGFLQWVMRHPSCVYEFATNIDRLLRVSRAAYRVVNGDTIAPISSSEEKDTLLRAFADLASTEFHGARQHLRLAAERATAGDWAGSIRESIHAVEATAKSLAPDTKELGPALAKLEAHGAIHKAMKQGFSSLYGFTSDEKGIRHALLDGEAAKVDQTDALFMLGACAAFVSYLINKARASGLIGK